MWHTCQPCHNTRSQFEVTGSTNGLHLSSALQVKRSLEWLHGEGAGNKRYAAVLILREMAENAPAVFNVHVRNFIEIIWAGLRDSKVLVREASVAALRVRPLSAMS